MGKVILEVNDVCKSYDYGPNNLEVLKNFTIQPKKNFFKKYNLIKNIF